MFKWFKTHYILLSNKHVINNMTKSHNMTAARTHANFLIKTNNMMIVSNSLLSDK
jgi:hypothetical protein